MLTIKTELIGNADLWPPTETGDWSEDNRIGREAAHKLIETMRDTEAPCRLGHVVKRMIEKGRFGGVEVGFFQHLATRLIA